METTAQDRIAYAPRRFTIDEYYRMADVGILNEGDRVELIDGCIVVREPPSPPHAGHITRLIHLFGALLDDRVLVNAQNPIQIDEYNHPQPDIALLRPREDFYETAHPTPADVYLLVEVALTSLRGDHQEKVPLYARSGIRELWIVNLREGLVEVYREPSEDGYLRILKLAPGASLSVEAFTDVVLPVGKLIRPREPS